MENNRCESDSEISRAGWGSCCESKIVPATSRLVNPVCFGMLMVQTARPTDGVGVGLALTPSKTALDIRTHWEYEPRAK